MQPRRDGREGERQRGRRGGRGDGASYFSDVNSACECDACVDGVGRARSPQDGTLEQFRAVKDRKFSVVVHQFDVSRGHKSELGRHFSLSVCVCEGGIQNNSDTKEFI